MNAKKIIAVTMMVIGGGACIATFLLDRKHRTAVDKIASLEQVIQSSDEAVKKAESLEVDNAILRASVEEKQSLQDRLDKQEKLNADHAKMITALNEEKTALSKEIKRLMELTGASSLPAAATLSNMRAGRCKLSVLWPILRNKTPKEVLQLLGKPDSQRDNETRWAYYDGYTTDVTEIEGEILVIFFGSSKVSGIRGNNDRSGYGDVQ